jgi:hypothetical protein
VDGVFIALWALTMLQVAFWLICVVSVALVLSRGMMGK